MHHSTTKLMMNIASANLWGGACFVPFFWAGSSDIFIFAPLLREEGGGGSEGRENFSKITGKRGKKGGGGGVDAGKGSGASLGGRGP